MNTNVKGSIAEQKVILRAIEKGYTVSRPINPCRYDLLIDDSKQIQRVQVKYADGQVGSESEGSVTARLVSWDHSYDYERSKDRTYTREEIDAIMVYIPKADKIAWLKPDLFENKKQIAIRIDPPKNNQTKGCNMLKDLEW